MELMELLYRIMEELSKDGVPIVFKGAMVLNLIVQKNNPAKTERLTKDIDGDWIGEGPTMSQMKDALIKATKKVDSTLDIKIYREFGERKSAGFKIVNERGEKVASIDLSVRKNEFCIPYLSYINDVSITGASLDKMLSDKIYAVSSKSVCRRVKDLVDIYVISYLTEVQIKNLCEIWEKTERQIGDFSEFQEKMFDIAEAYGKMKGIKNKPDFLQLYNRVSEFLCPFYNLEQNREAIWAQGEWSETLQSTKNVNITFKCGRKH